MIRVLGEEDAKAYWELRLEALETEPLAFGQPIEAHRGTSIEEIAQRLGDGMGRSFACGSFEDGEMVGMIRFARDQGAKEGHKGMIGSLFVRPSHRGKQIGRALVEAVISRARQDAGIEQILLTVMESQEAAVALYRSLGFQQYGSEPRAFKIDGRYTDEILMILMLQPGSLVA